MKREKIVVAMSGGVDSSVAAALLKEQGHEVVGITLQIWQEATSETRGGGCCSLGAVEDARRVATKIGIPHYVLNYREPFAEKVIDPFVEAYKRGRTPNPCINCNRHIKFDALLRQARALGADGLATGHYARVFRDPAAQRFVLARAGDPSKDQTYALYASTQEQLAFMRMPLGEVASKDETRAIARKYGLLVADKPDSQEICFVQNGDYTRFLSERAPEALTAGNFVDADGRTLGRHEGVAFYTVGQRKRINVGSATPLYVLRVHADTNEVVVGANDALLCGQAYVDDFNWVSLAPPPFGAPVRCAAKIRYNMPPATATAIRYADGSVRLTFDEPVRAVTPGQAAVLYSLEDDGRNAGRVLGGGTICEPGEEPHEE